MSSSADDLSRNRSIHQPVMLREVMQNLHLQPGMTVVDGTVGAGGHSRHIAKAIGPEGHLIGLDRDPMMLDHAAKALREGHATLIQSSYADLGRVLQENSIDGVDRILIDLGLSSDQLSHPDRGFGFQTSGELDMRFDRSSGIPAWELLAQSSRDEIAKILETYGEEPHATAIAEGIVRSSPVTTVADLVRIVESCVPGASKGKQVKHPATRVFQALRIAVNEEFQHLEAALTQTFPGCLKTGGIAVAITFHSLEDRIVKLAFQDQTKWEPLNPKPITPTANERKMNPRSRSAKLRSAKTISPN